MLTTLFEIIHNVSTLGWMMVFGGILSLTISGIIFWQDITRKSSLFFFTLGILSLLWALSFAFFEGTTGGNHAQEGIKALYIAAAAVPVFLFMFFYTFSVERKQVSFLKYVMFFLPFISITIILLASPDFIADHQEIMNGQLNVIVLGNGFLSYAVYISAYLLAGVILLVNKYRESAGIFKVAIRRILIAAVLAYIAAIVTSLLSPLFIGGSDLFWVGHVALFLLIFVMSYIIAKYNFWNIKVVATEFFISLIIFVMIAEIFFASSLVDLIIKTGITILIIFSCAFLDGSVKREIQSRDKILRLSQDIDLISKRLKVLDRTKSEFLAIASHHLRDPLTVIREFSSLLLDGTYGELPPPVKDALEKIFESSKRLITMVADFMDVSKIESGDMNYQFADVDMKKLILGLSDEMKQNADYAHLAFGVTIDEGIELNVSFVVNGDGGKLRQVLSNLIDNSIKYTPKGEVSVLLSKSTDGKKILFSIADTGIGMSEDTKGKIFRKFSRAEGVSRVYTEGTGLGLYVAKEIIKKHGGRVWAESKGEGHGSTFYVELEAKG